MSKNYVLDTNILLSYPNAIYGFEDNTVVITYTTLQELDSKKKNVGEVGKHARDAIKLIEVITSKGNKEAGETFPLENGGELLIAGASKSSLNNLPVDFKKDSADNMILATILEITDKFDGEETILVTNDVSLRISASILDIKAQAYQNDHMASEEEYAGTRRIVVAAKIVEKLKKMDAFNPDEIDSKDLKGLTVNEFVYFQSDADETGVYTIYKNGMLERIPDGNTRCYGVTPKNYQQACAIAALLDDSIPLVIMKGPAGAAKTFLALAGGLEQTYDKKREAKFQRMLITRNNQLIEEHGFLPGDIYDKMAPLIMPFTDNLFTLLKKGADEETEQIQIQIDDMFATKVIDVCPVGYMRGRSITDTYLICDEVQNCSMLTVRDIVTRIGNGSKLILCGDPSQIDNMLLDKWNNGLTVCASKMKGSPLVAQITFEKESSVRSPLASEAIVRM